MISRYIALAVLVACSAFGAAAANKPADARIYDLAVAVDDPATTLKLMIDLDLEAADISRETELVYTPVVRSEAGTDSLELEPLIVAGRSRWYYYLRNGEIDDPEARIYRAGAHGHAVIEESVPFLDWMNNCRVELRRDVATCCDTPELWPGTGLHGHTDIALVRTGRPELPRHLVFAPPVNAGPVVKSLKGSAFVSFVVNRTELKPDYMVNRREIAKILKSIDYVREDSDATITRIHIKGFASPEGPYANNVRLAQGRTVTLSNYVRDLYHFPDSIITNSFEPEDWAGLRKYVTDSLDYDIAHRPEILEIIDSNLGYDEKDHTLRRKFPDDYAVILKQIYPWLRHSDYTVSYAIKEYKSVEEIKRVFESDPTRLRNVDFYTLAQSYPTGSDKYNEVFEKAVEIYPDDPMANLNAANVKMTEGDLDAAQSHLLKSGNTPQAQFARGVLAAKRGDYREALKYFHSAADSGIDAAAAYIESIRQIQDYNPVTILAKPTKQE